MPTSLRILQAEPRRNHDVSIQGRHRPAPSCPDSVQSKDRSKNRLQRTKQDDQPRHADLHPYQMKREADGELQPNQSSCTNAMSSPIAVTSRSFRLAWSFDEATVRTLSMWAAWGRRRDAFASHTQNFHRNNRCSGCASAFRNTLSL